MNIGFLTKLAPYAKAVVGFIALLIPFLTSLVVVLTDIINGRIDATNLTLLGASAAALAGGTKAIYQVKNLPVYPPEQ